MKQIVKVSLIILIVFFLSIYLSKYTSNYYENKTSLTEEAIEKYEKDLKAGKEIHPKEYLEKEKNYNNRISKIGVKTSKIIEKSFNKSLKILLKYLENIEKS